MFRYPTLIASSKPKWRTITFAKRIDEELRLEVLACNMLPLQSRQYSHIVVDEGTIQINLNKATGRFIPFDKIQLLRSRRMLSQVSCWSVWSLNLLDITYREKKRLSQVSCSHINRGGNESDLDRVNHHLLPSPASSNLLIICKNSIQSNPSVHPLSAGENKWIRFVNGWWKFTYNMLQTYKKKISFPFQKVLKNIFKYNKWISITLSY